MAYNISVLEFIGALITSVWHLDLYRVTLCACSIAFCAEYCTYVLHVPFIELLSALNILLQLVQVFSFCWLVSPFREWNNFNIKLYCIYRCLSAQNYIYPFQNLSLGFILKIFLKFRKFQPRYSYKIYSYIKKRVYDK